MAQSQPVNGRGKVPPLKVRRDFFTKSHANKELEFIVKTWNKVWEELQANENKRPGEKSVIYYTPSSPTHLNGFQPFDFESLRRKKSRSQEEISCNGHQSSSQ